MEFSSSKQKLSNGNSYWLQGFIYKGLQPPMSRTFLARSWFVGCKPWVQKEEADADKISF
ncbi:hypothetical protein [Dendronalium sp. ChiSLP03b]|uniref:hypothetical protein n=1 Tax=Dendronalium sp. ChiSLP03b TaxID=3075381 RepID=UPI00391D6B0F